jgi:hypothetical protein
MPSRSASIPTPRGTPRLGPLPPRPGQQPSPPPRPQRAARGALVARGAALGAVFLVALEVTCRVDDLIRFGTPMLSPFTSQADLMVRDELGAHGRPGSRFQKWVMNDLGMRGPEAAPVPAPGTLRVVTAGASETFGLYESPDREYPRQLEDSLRAALGACGDSAAPARAEVLNAALPGMTLPTVTQDLRLRVPALRPGVVVLYATPAQYLDNEPPFAARADSSGAGRDLAWERTLEPRVLTRLRDQGKQLLPAALQSWLRRRDIERSRRSHPDDWRFTGVPDDRLGQFERDVRAAVGAIRASGARPVLATHTNRFVDAAEPDPHQLFAWERFYPRAPGAVIVAFDSAANEVTRRVARDSSVALADVERAIRGGDPALFADFSHFTDAGSARVAGVLTPAIVGAPTTAGLCAPPPSP